MAPAEEKRDATSQIASHSLAAPSSHAVAFRLTPELKQQLFRSQKAGRGCHLQLSADGSGAFLRLGTDIIQLQSKPLADTEVITIPDGGGTITSAVVGAKLAPTPGRHAGKSKTSLAAKAQQLEQQRREISPPGAPSRRTSPPLPAGRTTAPQRTSLSLRQPSQSKEVRPLSHLSAPAVQPKASTGKAATAAELQAAFSAGGLKLLLTAVLCEKPLAKGALTKKVEDVCRAAGSKPPSFKLETQPELRHIAEYRSPGVYALLPGPRDEFEKARGSLVQQNIFEALKTHQAKQRQKSGGAVQHTTPGAKPANRDWTKELLSRRKDPHAKPMQTPSAGHSGPGASNAPTAPAKAEGKVQRGAAGKAKRPVLILLEKREALQAAPSTPSVESNATRVNASSPEQEVHAPPRQARPTFTADKPPLKRPAAEPATEPAKEQRKKPRKSTTRDLPQADSSWYQQHVSREPQHLASISSREQFEQVSCEYKTKYSVYHRLHQEIQEAKRLSKLFTSSSSDSEGVGNGLRRLWVSKQQQLPQMKQAYQCLHTELASLKDAGQAFASTY